MSLFARGTEKPAARTSVAALALTAGVFGSAVMAPAAMAHDSVLSSNPANGEVVNELPQEITLEFSGTPQGEFNTVALSQDGEVLFSEEPEVEGQTLTVDVPDDVEAGPGDYMLGYQITSSDGHATRGSLEFSIAEGASGSGDSAGSETTEATPATTGSNQGEDSSSLPSWLLPLAGIVVIAGALVMAIARFRNLKSE